MRGVRVGEAAAHPGPAGQKENVSPPVVVGPQRQPQQQQWRQQQQLDDVGTQQMSAVCTFARATLRGAPQGCAQCGRQCPRGMVAQQCVQCGQVHCLRCDSGSSLCAAAQAGGYLSAESGGRPTAHPPRGTDSLPGAAEADAGGGRWCEWELAVDTPCGKATSTRPEDFAPSAGVGDSQADDAGGVHADAAAQLPPRRRSVWRKAGAICCGCGVHLTRGTRAAECRKCSGVLCTSCAAGAAVCQSTPEASRIDTLFARQRAARLAVGLQQTASPTPVAAGVDRRVCADG